MTEPRRPDSPSPAELSPLPPRTAEAETAETCLLKALRAATLKQRERWARQGLARTSDDPELEALLLRQLYLVALERQEDRLALQLAEEMIELGELGDIARQDAARAALGCGNLDAAVGHLRIAARICPEDRRAFHWATVGALLRFGGRYPEAIQAFSRARRWATQDRTLYQAQLVLTECAASLQPSTQLTQLREHLESLESQHGYTEWVLGELCALLGDRPASRRYLTRFLSRLHEAPRAKYLALQGEIARAKALLQELSA